MFNHREWQRNNPDKVRKYHKKYYLKHREHIMKKAIEWNSKHSKRRNEITKNWKKRNPIKSLIIKKRSYYKRKKELGFEVLWIPENINEKMEWHHINKLFVVLIPFRIHDSIQHNVFTRENMNKINNMVFQYIIDNSQ